MIWVSLLAIATAVVTGAMTWGMRRDASERRRQREADELAELIRELGPHDCRTIEAGTVTADKIKAGHVTLSGESAIATTAPMTPAQARQEER